MRKSILLMACVALLVAARPAKEGYEVGDIAKDFTLKNVDGKMVSLADFTAAKGFIVIFDCNTCPVSKAYNSRIISLNNTYQAKGFPVVAINPNHPDASPGDSFEDMVKYAKAKGYTFPYLYDPTQEVAKTFGATNTPHVFVLTKAGSNLKVAYIGAIDNNTRDEKGASKKYVEAAVDQLLKNEPVSTSKTKAVGCGVKWKDS